MPALRLPMRKIRDVLRLKHDRGLTHRAVAQACSIGVGTVTLYLQRAAALGLGWPLPPELDEAALEARLFPRAAPLRARIRPDCGWIHRELRRVGVTLQLLWEEYAQVHPDGYRYSQFCVIYRQWARRLRPSMRQVHRAGEKTFIDFSWEDARDRRSAHGRGPACRPLRGRPRGELLHLRRSHGEPAAARLGRGAHPDGGVLPGRDGPVGPRPAQKRHHAALPV